MAGQAQTQSVDLFDLYFRRADLDHDGRISGAEAVNFFRRSNLPQQVLAQIWTYADQNRAGFLGRAEFYNALKLVTVAQKRDLTPEIVKAALYSPASAKIPAPQISLAATPAPQSNTTAGPPIPQLSGAASTASQTASARGPYVAANTSTNQQLFPSQQNQFMKPPRPLPPGTAFRPPQGVGIQGVPVGGGAPGGVTSQVPNRGITPTTQDGLGLLPSGFTPSAQPRPQGTSGMSQPAAQKPQDSTFPSYQVEANHSQSSVVQGNGFASDSVFGDVYSATSSLPKQDPQMSASITVGLPISSAMVSSSGIQLPVRPSAAGSLQSSFTQQPVSRQHQQVQTTMSQNQQVSAQSSATFASTGFSAGSGNSASGQPHVSWPRMTQTDIRKYTKVFVEVDTDRDGKITGEEARNLFLSWRMPREVLKQVWDLSDQDNDSMLSLREFCVALYLMERHREGRPLPAVFPSNMVLDETLLPAAGQRALAPGNANWGSTTGVQRPRGMPGTQPVAPATGVSPSSQGSIPQADGDVQPSKQKPRVPVLEKHLIDQLSKEEQDLLNSKSQEATEADKKVEALEKEILDSREKIEFFRKKMQELILYKSRCDNRLNEITERVSADKREVESLAKKYEEKYKQSGDVASKLTLEEATFRDIQAKKMELYQEIVKMEQDGSADGFQTRADRIQLDLEELVKSLNERCKSYGLRSKPTALVELPFGWQSGIQGGAADWDEDWDKFEDEGFTSVKELTLDVQNVIAPPKPKKSSVRNTSSSTDDVHAVSSPTADGKSESQPIPAKRVPENESADARSEEGVSRTPPDSPAEKNSLESPSKLYRDFRSRNNFGADGSPFYDSPRAAETQSPHGGSESVHSGDKIFDEPSWGAFDSHYDTDSVWDFNTANSEDIDQEKHGEGSFFSSDDNWGLNPIRTGSTDADSMFQKKSAFTFDSVPSTPLFNSVNSPPTVNTFQNTSPFAFADSVPSTPMYSYSNSPRRFSGGSEEHSFDSFSRFDSFRGPEGGNYTPRESLTRFDSMRSTRDSDYGQSLFAPSDSFTRFDSFRSTADSEYNHGVFPPTSSLTRFDSTRSTRDSDYGPGFPSFDEADPFGSSEPFRSSRESETPRTYSDKWRAF